MKAISLWQPWATLWVMQIKKFETRSWPFPKRYTGAVAVHAAKKKMRFFGDYLPAWQVEGINQALCMAGLIYEELPYGAFVGVCDSMKSNPITEHPDTDLELELGNWSHGRHYWIPENMQELPDPVPFRGQQGIFNVDDHIIIGGQPAKKTKPNGVILMDIKFTESELQTIYDNAVSFLENMYRGDYEDIDLAYEPAEKFDADESELRDIQSIVIKIGGE